jgi:hypothetical protein
MKLIRGNPEQQFQEIVNKAIDKTQFADVTTHATPDTEFSIEHGLGFIPVGFIVIRKDKAGDVYSGATVWNQENIFLKCTVASAAIRVLIF